MVEVSHVKLFCRDIWWGELEFGLGGVMVGVGELGECETCPRFLRNLVYRSGSAPIGCCFCVCLHLGMAVFGGGGGGVAGFCGVVLKVGNGTLMLREGSSIGGNRNSGLETCVATKKLRMSVMLNGQMETFRTSFIYALTRGALVVLFWVAIVLIDCVRLW